MRIVHSALYWPVLLMFLVSLVSTDALANNKKVRPLKQKTGMTRQEIESVTSAVPEVRQARLRVQQTKRALNELADDIAASQRTGGDLLKRPGTRQRITNTINEHGDAVQAETRTVKATINDFMRLNNIVELPRAPSGPPPPRPPARPTAGGALLQPPSGQPPARRDMRPAQNSPGRHVRFKDSRY